MASNHDNPTAPAGNEGVGTPPGPSVDTQPIGWRLPVFLLIVLVVLAGLGRFFPSSVPLASPGDAPGEPLPGAQVTVLIEGPNTQPRALLAPWRPGITVLDALSGSGVLFEVSGRGANAFVLAIDGVANGRDTQSGWQFWVNGQLATVGAGARPLEAGDRVLWRHAAYE